MKNKNIDRLFLDYSDIVGYISDMKTYELTYMTQAAIMAHGLSGEKDYLGQKCYKVIHGLDEPCPFCQNDKLSFDYEHRWEHYNAKLDRWFDCTDRLLHLNGGNLRLQVAKDVTARKEGDILFVTGNITSEDVIYRCLNILTEENNISVAMARVLKSIGAYYQADRVYIVELDVERKVAGKTFEWCHPGIFSALRSLQDIPEDMLSKWLNTLENDEHVIIDSIGEDLDPNSELHKILVERKVQRLTLSPLRNNEQFIGFLGIDNPRIKADNKMLLSYVSGFILEALQRHYLSDQLDFMNTQTNIQQLLDFIRTKLEVNAAYVMEALAIGKGFLCTHMSVSHEHYNLLGLERTLSDEDFSTVSFSYDKDGLSAQHPNYLEQKINSSVLHYGIFQNGELNGSIGVIDYQNPERKWSSSERAIIAKAGQVIANAIVSSRLQKINAELERISKQLEATAATLRQERQLYRNAIVHDCEYAYIVNVNKNKIKDIYKGGYLEKYSFSVDLPYDEAMALVVEQMKPIILHGMPSFHLCAHYIEAYEQGKRMVEVEYYVPDTGEYKRKSIFLSKDEFGTMYVFVVTHDITTRRREELETEKALTQLADVAKQVGQGNLDVQIDLSAPGLVGVLANVFSRTIVHLKWSINTLNQQATQDPMTGVKNKRAWQEASDRLNETIQDGTANFAVAVCDVNNLKKLNDTVGHEAGDSLIIRASRHICDTFKHSPVYRIGGDEFAVILEDRDLGNAAKLVSKFYTTMAKQAQSSEVEPPVSIALGLSYFRAEDKEFADVFHRADEAMYRKKAAMKAEAKK